MPTMNTLSQRASSRYEQTRMTNIWMDRWTEVIHPTFSRSTDKKENINLTMIRNIRVTKNLTSWLNMGLVGMRHKNA